MNRSREFIIVVANQGDTTAPSVTGFAAASPSGLTIAITTFTASEAGVYFLITESATPPAVDDVGWNLSAPTTYAVLTSGTKTLYPWVKDAAGNVSSVYGSPASVYVPILLDQFTTNASAPLTSPRTCEPIGTATITDAENSVSIASNKLTLGTQTAHNFRGYFTGVQTFAAGLAFFAKQGGTNAVQSRVYFGTAFSNQTSGGGVETAYVTDAAGAVGNVITNGANDTIALIRTTSGIEYILQNSKLLWVSTKVSTANIGMSCMQYLLNLTSTFDNLEVAILGAPWAADYGLATQRIATNSAGDTISQTADAIVEWTFTAQTGVTKDLYFRYVDDNNTWIARMDQANSKIFLYEKNASTETERGATGGTAFTQTNGVSYTVKAIMDTQTIYLCAGTGSPGPISVKTTYTSASFNQSATTAKAPAAGTNFISYPRTITGAALTEYQRVYPF